MKVLPIFAVVVIGSFATLGFAAGTFVSTQERAAPELSDAHEAKPLQADLASPARPAPDAEAEAILRAAEANSSKTAADDSADEASVDTAPARPIAATEPRPHLVKMANVTLPVRKPASVSFVVADLAVAVRDAESAAHYEIPQNAARLQAAIESAMASAAATPILRGVTIDSQKLSGKLTTTLQQDFNDVEDVLFLTLYKHDVGYN